MKNQVLILSLLFITLIACSSEENAIEEKEEQEIHGIIIGKWELYEDCSFDYEGTGCSEVAMDMQHFYEFFENGVVKSNQYEEFDENCVEGTYTIEEDSEILIVFDCIEYKAEIRKLTTKELHFVLFSDDGGLINKYRRL